MYTTCPSKKLVDERSVERMCCAVLKGRLRSFNLLCLPFKTAQHILSTLARQHAFFWCASAHQKNERITALCIEASRTISCISCPSCLSCKMPDAHASPRLFCLNPLRRRASALKLRYHTPFQTPSCKIQQWEFNC